MFVVGFVGSTLVSLASFFAILAFASPHGGAIIVGLFFLTFFTSISSIAVLGHFFILRLKGISPKEHKKYWSVAFRRAIFAGGFTTLLVIFETMRILTLLSGIALLIFFVGAEVFVTYRESSFPG